MTRALLTALSFAMLACAFEAGMAWEERGHSGERQLCARVAACCVLRDDQATRFTAQGEAMLRDIIKNTTEPYIP